MGLLSLMADGQLIQMRASLTVGGGNSDKWGFV